MAVWAKRSMALLALIVFTQLGINRAGADWSDDADPPPELAPAAFTVEAEPPPVGTSVINRRPAAAPAALAARTQAAPAPQQRVAPAPAPARFAAPRNVAPARRPYGSVVNGRPVRVAQAPPAQHLPEQVQPEHVDAAPIDSAVETDSSELQSPLEGADPWCDEYMANGPDALVYSSGDWMNDGCWFADADIVLMHRANPKSRVLALDTTFPATDGLNPTASMATANRGFHIAPGIRGTIGHYVGRDWANRDQSVEFTALGLFDWEKSDGVASSFPQRLYSPFDPGFVFDPAIGLRNAVIGGFAASDVQEFEYTTNLNSFELNFRTRYRLARDVMTAMPDGTWTRQLDPGPTPSLLAGLRYYRINETFNWNSQRFNNPALGQNNLGNASGNYDIETSNDLFGVQFGADWTRQEKEWRMGAWIKLGGLVNFSHQHSTVVVDDNFFSGDINSDRQASEDVFTFAGEAGLSGAYHFNPNVSLRGGLELLWIQSVAVAPEQISFNFAAPPTVDLSGNVFYMGASVGLEVIW